MRAADGRDRVELHAAESVDGRGDVGGTCPPEARCVALVGDDIPPELCDGDRLHGLVLHRDVPRHGRDTVDPRLHVRVLRHVELALVGDVRVAVDRDVGSRVRVADEPVAALGEVPFQERRARGSRRSTSRRADPGTCPSRPSARSRTARSRSTARARTARRTSTAGRGRGRVAVVGQVLRCRPRGTKGSRSTRRGIRPSSSSSVGTRSAGFLPPRISGRFDRSNTSSSTRSYSMPRWARICRAFQQFPESWLL